ncbi:unnamed protein product [Bursaphelenchus xylophilus]|uniref:L-aminoadipate-semialdehyde dehydrogenase-phosphopantetheinyl transferase n=1 Tax=Bursaphelenchus xylophilus TaxID=6326 RepID=A0A1I7SQF6_BURXY|nr:unnamed protein product [Bursaphelenchus xylophilus]CAG9109827.1 unnamed protein product [Bursaphelenchus xylophilus]
MLNLLHLRPFPRAELIFGPATRKLINSQSIRSLAKMSDAQCRCRRWAFSLQRAMSDPNFESDYRKAIQCVDEGDYEKITAFRHKEDTLACLAGRLFLRRAVVEMAKTPWHEIDIQRTERGKPFIVKPENFNIGLNASHQGDYTVFATSCTDKVGVDVMRLDMARGNKTADQYINSMAKSASADELKNMRTQATDQMKMTMFYRYWCLKEALLKATGQGIVEDLSRYDFRIDPSDKYGARTTFVTSTYVNEDGKRLPQWHFEESFVDEKHSAAVCREKKMPKYCEYTRDPDHKIHFRHVDFKWLLEPASVLNPGLNDIEEYNNFQQKPKKLF